MTNLKYVEFIPKTKVKYAVIWLHGLGADGYDFMPIVPRLMVADELGIQFIFPHAPSRPVTLNMGMVMPAWFDIHELSKDGIRDKPGIEMSVQQIQEIILDLNSHGIASDHIFLAGFSQGGTIAVHCALNYPEALAGLMILSSTIALPQLLTHHQANKNLPIFIAHGSLDPVLPLQYGELARDYLIEKGYKPQWHQYAMGHEVCSQEIDDIGRWFRTCCH